MSIKKIIALVLTVAVVIIALGAISSFAGKETERISPWKFSRGALDNNGAHVETKKSIYTKDMFECAGLSIEQDFESHLTYDVYYYDYAGKYVDSDKGLRGDYSFKIVPTGTNGKYYGDEYFSLAKFARVVIHPEVPEGISSSDFEIKFYEIYSIANDIKISVNKDQTYIYESENLFENQSTRGLVEDNVTIRENGKYIYDFYDVYVKVADSEDPSVFNLVCENGYVDELNYFDLQPGVWCKTTVKAIGYVDHGEVYTLAFQFPEGSQCYVFGYNK